MGDVIWVLLETDQTGRFLIRNYTGRVMEFEDPMTATVMADGLRHGGHEIEVIKIDRAYENPNF